MRTFASLLASAALTTSALAHSIFQASMDAIDPTSTCFVNFVNADTDILRLLQEMYVNGVDQGHITGIRVPDYDGVCAC